MLIQTPHILYLVCVAAISTLYFTSWARSRHWTEKKFLRCWFGLLGIQVLFFAGYGLFDAFEDAYYRRIAAECLQQTASGRSFEETKAFGILCERMGSETEVREFWDWFCSQAGEPYDFHLLVKLRGITDPYAYGLLPIFLAMMFVICFLWDLFLLGVWKLGKHFPLLNAEDPST